MGVRCQHDGNDATTMTVYGAQGGVRVMCGAMYVYVRLTMLRYVQVPVRYVDDGAMMMR